MDLFNQLAEIYKEFETSIESKEDYVLFEIKNPHWEENIKVVDDGEIVDGEKVPTVYFAYQHAHIYLAWMKLESLFEYIDDIIYGKRVSVEFFIDGQRGFGGDEHYDKIDFSSGEALLKSFWGENHSPIPYAESAKGCNWRCAIRGWDSSHNKDINFVL